MTGSARRLIAVLATLAVGTALAISAQPASGKPPAGHGANNPYSPAYNAPYRHGVTPTVGQQQKMANYAKHHNSTTTTGPETLAFGGGIDGIGVTSGTPKIYLVFWGSQWGTQSTNANGNLTFTNDPQQGAPYLQQLFKGLGTGNELWSGTMTQYCDGSSVASGATTCPTGAPHVGYPTGGALAGVWYDNSAAEPSAASGHQIGTEAVNAAAHFGNTTAASNRYAQYDILSPTGLNPDNYKTQGFCAWHDYNGDSTLSGGGVTSPYGDIAFTNMPYVMDQGASCGQNFVNAGGTLDGYSIVNGHEYAETVSDQNPAGGWTNHQNNSFGGQENGDECAWISSGQGASANVAMGTGSFAMQSTWSNDTNRCDISHAIVSGTTTNDFSISDSPASRTVTKGSSTTYTVSTAVTSGSAQSVSLSASGLPSGTTASFSPTSVTAGSSSTMTVSTTSSTLTGTYTLTIQGTATSGSHSTTASLTVNAPATNDFSISANPSSLSIVQGNNGTSTISTAVTSGSAQTVSLSVTGVPSGATASFNPTSVTAGGSSTLTVTTGTAAAGTYTLTITGTGSSATHTTTVSLTITAPVINDFSIAANPTSVSVAQGSSGTSTISTTVTSGSAATVSLSAGVSPAGPTASLSPTSVTAGGSSTLTVSVGATVATGSYTVTVTGTEGSATHSATVTVTVTSSGSGSGITNGGFETGSFSGWTVSGTTSVVTSNVHSGTYAAQAGSTSPTSGDSSITQTFTVPSGMSALTFWYDVVCPDTVTYDWATATLKDNTAGTTSTPLGKTCVSNSGWVQVSAAVTAGHSYTLTLTSHDDNYPGDPTYTHFDDVALSNPTVGTNVIANGGLETGSFSNWAVAGTTSVVTSNVHSGTYAAQGGSTAPTNGDSTITQSFTAAAGDTKVAFWYDVVCPDTVTYDWATATLKDNTTGTTTTPLGKTCVSNSGWKQVTATITAGHSYTLTMTSHDDNYPSDPTYTHFDDVTTS